MTGTVTTGQEGHLLTVMVDGVIIKTFHEISDDYAYTNRIDYARALTRALPDATNLTDATNKAWHDM